VPHQHLIQAVIRVGRLAVAVFFCVMLDACAAKPLIPYSADTPPLVLVPATHAGIQDQRTRFREIFCAVLEAHAHTIPDYQPCDEALTRVGAEPAGTSRPVTLGPSSRRLVAAVVTAAGAVGGSALANDAEQYQANLLRHFPKATCGAGDGGAVESLRTGTRKAWLAAHALPREVPFYTLVAYPQPERISWVLKSSYNQLSRIDARNDSQVIFYDQVVPGSTLLGYLNADHWAVAVPFARTHSTIAAVLVTQNAYPREALVEAVLRFVEEDLESPQR
jgi:hypothetical protein